MVKSKNLEKRILVVDDDLNDLKLIYENLRDRYSVSIMNNVPNVLNLIEKDINFHYILTDLLMPKEEYNGRDLIRSLKAKDCQIPIIAMSGLGRREDSARAILDGANYFVEKDKLKAPQSKEELSSTIEEIEIYVKRHKDNIIENEKLRAQAFHDHITQLYNKYKFEIDIKDEIARHSRRIRQNKESVFSILYIDINDMKLANDNLGHEYTDQNLLKNLGEVIRHRRKIDSGYRTGGDEFIVILPDTDEAGATVVANSIANSYDNLRKKFTYERYGKLDDKGKNGEIGDNSFVTIRDNAGTLSIGIAQAPLRDSLTRETLLSWGENAMYTAKEQAKKKDPRKSVILIYLPGMTKSSQEFNENPKKE